MRVCHFPPDFICLFYACDCVNKCIYAYIFVHLKTRTLIRLSIHARVHQRCRTVLHASARTSGAPAAMQARVHACAFQTRSLVHPTHPPVQTHTEMTESQALTSWPEAMPVATSCIMPFLAAIKSERRAPCVRRTAAASSWSLSTARSNGVRPH